MFWRRRNQPQLVVWVTGLPEPDTEQLVGAALELRQASADTYRQFLGSFRATHEMLENLLYLAERGESVTLELTSLTQEIGFLIANLEEHMAA